MTNLLNLISLWALPVIIIGILTFGLIKKVPVYEVFTDGAKDGFQVAVKIIPYLVAIIVGISMFICFDKAKASSIRLSSIGLSSMICACPSKYSKFPLFDGLKTARGSFNS